MDVNLGICHQFQFHNFKRMVLTQVLPFQPEGAETGKKKAFGLHLSMKNRLAESQSQTAAIPDQKMKMPWRA